MKRRHSVRIKGNYRVLYFDFQEQSCDVPISCSAMCFKMYLEQIKVLHFSHLHAFYNLVHLIAVLDNMGNSSILQIAATEVT